jgi:hypothetical protein
LCRWPPPSSRRDLASVVRVLLGGDLISRSALARPDRDRFSLRGGYRVGTDFRETAGRLLPAVREMPDFIGVTG